MGRQCDRQLPFVRKTQKAGVFFSFSTLLYEISFSGIGRLLALDRKV